MYTTRKSALYISNQGREWAAWLNPQGELLAIPADEEPCTDNELAGLFDYLEKEGFFPEFFKL